jgi:hypothetical protein
MVKLLNAAGATCHNSKMMNKDLCDSLFHGGLISFISDADFLNIELVNGKFKF